MSPAVNDGAHAVTGAFSYTGKYIARRLLSQGRPVRALVRDTSAPNPFGQAIDTRRLDFDNEEQLTDSLRGVAVLYNTYWVRFSRAGMTFERAVENTLRLLRCAAQAGVRRVVHLSVSNPSEDSPLPYFRGKALQERAVRESGLPYAIVRPTLVFGKEDILVHNIAWLTRKFPFFLMPGAGDYRVQPVFVEDVAELAAAAAAQGGNLLMDAAGPERYTFKEFVRLIATALGRRPLIISVPPGLAVSLGTMVGWAVRDVLITRDEIRAIMANLLLSRQATASTSFRAWVAENASTLGETYTSELARHWR